MCFVSKKLRAIGVDPVKSAWPMTSIGNKASGIAKTLA